jgi:putative transposase
MGTQLMSCLPEIASPTRKPYPSDLSDAEWEVSQKLIPKPKGFDIRWKLILGKFSMASSTSNAQDVNGRCCLKTCLPTARSTVYFQKWQRKGIWQQMHDQMRAKL